MKTFSKMKYLIKTKIGKYRIKLTEFGSVFITLYNKKPPHDFFIHFKLFPFLFYKCYNNKSIKNWHDNLPSLGLIWWRIKRYNYEKKYGDQITIRECFSNKYVSRNIR